MEKYISVFEIYLYTIYTVTQSVSPAQAAAEQMSKLNKILDDDQDTLKC